VGSATTVVGSLLVVPINGRGGLEFPVLSILLCLNAWHRGLLLLHQRARLLDLLLLWEWSGEGSTEGKVVKDLLVGTSNLTIRKSNLKFSKGAGPLGGLRSQLSLVMGPAVTSGGSCAALGLSVGIAGDVPALGGGHLFLCSAVLLW
jgi:hypothetical protein